MYNKEVESQLGPTSNIPFAPADEKKTLSNLTIMQIASTRTDEAKIGHPIMPSEDESDYSLHSSKFFTEELRGMLNSPSMGSSFHEEEKKEAWESEHAQDMKKYKKKSYNSLL